jgi:hypothetical protein
VGGKGPNIQSLPLFEAHLPTRVRFIKKWRYIDGILKAELMAQYSEISKYYYAFDPTFYDQNLASCYR